ncbi:alanine aminotransferase 1-like isoform X2 [Rissa tridactyla]|uniref:alanine aminotransferase 1-like isoform X2 n=1 Tax=Rissa tridactyla TaxID=75485 RepID=UPI0023BB08FE|nr:alanine aminotransferase 1-like isoform X2 [Rissa tridactyla]
MAAQGPGAPWVPKRVPGVPADCSSDDAHAVGRGPLPVLRQVAAACVCPQLLGDPALPEVARRRARRVLGEMDAGSIGGYNHEHRGLGVPARVARFLQRRDAGVPCHPRNVVLCSGTSSILPFVLSLLVDAGSAVATGVLVPVPGPPLLGGATGLAGAVAVPYPLDEERGWAVDGRAVREALRRARDTCHPKVLCVVNPGDPTGHVLSRQNMEDVVRLAAEENLLLLADEVQQERAFLPGRPFLSFKRVLWEMGAPLSSAVQLVSFYSLSKSVAGESGFRAGFLELVNVEEGVTLPFQLAQSIPRPCVLGRILLDILMDPPDEGDPIQQALEEHRQGLLRDLAHNARLVQEVLGRAPGIRCRPVQGGARAFPRIQLPPRAQRQARALGLEPDVFFCQKLQEATGITVAPGSQFGQPEGTHHIVLSLLPPAAMLEQILLALTRFHATFLRQFS